MPGKFPNENECINIVILGETGTGKSTFINALCNYFCYDTMQDAEKGGVKILIPTRFTTTDAKYNGQNVFCEPNVPGAEEPKRSNESSTPGQSATQDPKSYIFSRHNDEGSIRIIDTPGLGDTRENSDAQNFDKILSYLSGFRHIHAFLILLKPNCSRLTFGFRFCLDELLSRMHKSAAQNILFGFTHARTTFFMPGDTLRTLEKHLVEITNRQGIEIPLNASTLFSFDNEGYRFLCACSVKDVNFTASERKEFKKSWLKSVTETQKLIDQVLKLKPHNVSDTISLNNVRNIILSLEHPIAELLSQQEFNEKLVERRLDEIKKLTESDDLNDKLYMEQLVATVVQMPYSRIVCTSKSCVEYRPSTIGKNHREIVYESICMDNCNNMNIQADRCPNPCLLRCSIMNDNGNCTKCQCSWKTHKLTQYTVEYKREKVVSKEIKESIKRRDYFRTTIQLFLDEATATLNELRTEHEHIMQICKDFTRFLTKNSLIAYSDAEEAYIDRITTAQIERCTTDFAAIEQLIKERNERLRQINERFGPIQDHTIEEIHAKIEEIMALKHSGKFLKDIKNVRLSGVQEMENKHGVHVTVGTSQKNRNRSLGCFNFR